MKVPPIGSSLWENVAIHSSFAEALCEIIIVHDTKAKVWCLEACLECFFPYKFDLNVVGSSAL